MSIIWSNCRLVPLPFSVVDYRKGQLATVLVTGKWPYSNQPTHLALSPDGLVIAIGSGFSLYLYSALSGEPMAQIDAIHSGNLCRTFFVIYLFLKKIFYLISEPVKAVRFDSTSRFVLTTGDRYVRIFHNVPGYQMAVADLEAKLRKATNQTLRERIQLQLKDAQMLIDQLK